MGWGVPLRGNTDSKHIIRYPVVETVKAKFPEKNGPFMIGIQQ